MHVHNVSSYAPPGYELARTEYDGGATIHVFASPGRDDLALKCIPANAAEEIAALEEFKRVHEAKHQAWVEKHAPGIAEGIRAIADQKTPSVYERPVTIADLSHPDATGPVPALSTSAKPSRKRS